MRMMIKKCNKHVPTCASCGLAICKQFDNWCQKILAAGTQAVPVNPMTKRWNGNPSPNSKKKFNDYQTRYPQNISGKSQLAVPKLCGVKQRCLVVAVDFLRIQPMLLHEQLSDLAAMGWGLVDWKIWMLRNFHLSTQQNHGIPKQSKNISWFFYLFSMLFTSFEWRWMTKNIRKFMKHPEKSTKQPPPNSRPQKLVGDLDVWLLQREAIHHPWSPSRVGRPAAATTAPCCWWLLLHLKDADLWHPCPKNCTCLLFSSVFFMFFTHIISHPNAMEFGWDRGPRFTIYMKMYMAYVCTCTDHKVESSVQWHPILYHYATCIKQNFEPRRDRSQVLRWMIPLTLMERRW